MGRTSRGDNKSKQKRQQAILRLIQENPISRQETLLEYLSKEGFDATQATISRDIREMNLVKAATTTGYRYVSGHSEVLNPKMQARFETIFHESWPAQSGMQRPFAPSLGITSGRNKGRRERTC